MRITHGIMALLTYLKTSNPLPTANETGIGQAATKEANAAVSRALSEQKQVSTSMHSEASTRARKRKAYTTFSAEQRAAIG